MYVYIYIYESQLQDDPGISVRSHEVFTTEAIVELVSYFPPTLRVTREFQYDNYDIVNDTSLSFSDID